MLTSNLITLIAQNSLAAWNEGANNSRRPAFPHPKQFVAPYDRLSRVGMTEVARCFRVLSTGWFELRRLPLGWWPKYAFK